MDILFIQFCKSTQNYRYIVEVYCGRYTIYRFNSRPVRSNSPTVSLQIGFHHSMSLLETFFLRYLIYFDFLTFQMQKTI